MKKIILSIISLVAVLSMLTGCNFIDGFKEGFKEGVDKTVKEEIKKTAEKDYERGAWDGTTYKSEHLGMQFNLTEGWTIATEEEINKLMDVGTEMLEGDQKGKYDYSKLKVVYELFVQSGDSLSNVQFLSENLSLTPGGTALTEEKYIELVVQQVKSVPDSGFVFGEVSKKTIAGKEFTIITSTINDAAVQSMCYKKEGKFMTSIIITTSKGNEAEIEKQLKAFSKL